MREAQNVSQLETLEPDFVGMIFYEKSPRYVEVAEFNQVFLGINGQIKKVGVFVNTPIDQIKKKIIDYKLDLVQLHGGESVETCEVLRREGIQVIKVFSVTDTLPGSEIIAFQDHVDYFLFDTKAPEYGGSGKQFDWTILKTYSSKVPYFLSGGIGLDDIDHILDLELPGLYAIDVNSKFEIQPGLKNIELLKKLTEKFS